MELYPTPRSWRIALVTAAGASAVAALACVLAARAGGIAWFWGAVAAAAVATFAPAVGTLTSRVEADRAGVVVHRFGRSRRYAWSEVAEVHTVERRASVPDGTEYHWVFPGRRAHVVAVPCLRFTSGGTRRLAALAAPLDDRAHADECAAALERFRAEAVREPVPAA